MFSGDFFAVLKVEQEYFFSSKVQDAKANTQKVIRRFREAFTADVSVVGVISSKRCERWVHLPQGCVFSETKFFNGFFLVLLF